MNVPNQNATVLLVDDELMVARSLQSLLQLETDWNVLTFSEPERAIEELDRREVDVILSDFLMPIMDGITMLERAKEKQPFASRILLTGYADKANAIRAINEAGLYYYLEKPWDNAHLKLVVRNAVERARLIRDLDGRIAELEQARGELRDIRGKLIRAFL